MKNIGSKIIYALLKCILQLFKFNNDFLYNSDDIPEELPDAGGHRVEDGDPVGQLAHTQLWYMLPRSNI